MPSDESDYTDVSGGGGEYIQVHLPGDQDEDPVARVRCTLFGGPEEEAYIYPGSSYTLASEPGPDAYTVDSIELVDDAE